MGCAAVKPDDPGMLRRASQVLSAALADAGASAEIAGLLIATGRTAATDVQYAERVAAAAGRFAEVVEQLLEQFIGAALQEAVEADEVRSAEIRRWFAEPRETYTIEELAAMLRITMDDACDVYHDEIARLERLRGTVDDASAVRVGWTAALVTAAEYGLLRPFDIERALGADFVEARSGEGWRTVPVLIRVPRFVADAIAREPVIPQGLALSHRIERILFERFRSAFKGHTQVTPEA